MQKFLIFSYMLFLAFTAIAQPSTELVAQEKQSPAGQAIPPATQSFGAEAFTNIDHTEIRWLGNAGFHINSRGVNIMVDPLLVGFDMPLLIEIPSPPTMYLNWMRVTHAYLMNICKCHMPTLSFLISLTATGILV